MFRARRPSIFSTSHKLNATPSPLDASLPLRFAKNTQLDTSKVLRLLATHLLKTSRKYCHTKRFSPRYQTRLNVTKCHACHAKRSNGTFETSKKHPFCRNYHRHGHIAIAWTVANGCERLRTVTNGCERLRTVADVNATSSEHTLNPQTPRVKREPLLRIREIDF